MRNLLTIVCRWVIATSLAVATSAPAKKVVCIDQKKDGAGTPIEDGYLSNHEGWERQNLTTNDIIVKGGSLTDCLARVANGDTLVLIAHGIENTVTGERGVAFEWCGQQYTDFGAGAGQMPVPPGFSSLSNVSVSFCSCYSANDPDGTNGPNTSLTNKILRALGGRTNNTARGFVGQAAAGTSMVYWYPQKIDRLPKKQRDQARMNYDALIDQCLAADSSWQDKPPKNRSSPPPNPNQESCALQILQNCAALSNCLPMHFKIIYTIPTEATTNQHGGGSTGSSCGGASFQVLGLGRPEIDISGGSSGHATLTWTRQPVDFQLEYTADLDPPLTWSMATNPVSESAGVFFAQVDATGLSGYYRLAEAPPSAEAPTVLVPPHSLTVAQGQTATFNVQATGTPPLNYQWRRNGAILPGAGGSTYAISNVQPAQAGTYSVFVSNPAGLVESTPAVLTVQPQDQPPFISFIPTFTIPRNSSTGPIPFNIGDDNTPAVQLIVTASSSNTNLVPNINLVLGGSGPSRTLAATPIPNQAGTTTITITVREPNGLATSEGFLLAVGP